MRLLLARIFLFRAFFLFCFNGRILGAIGIFLLRGKIFCRQPGKCGPEGRIKRRVSLKDFLWRKNRIFLSPDFSRLKPADMNI